MSGVGQQHQYRYIAKRLFPLAVFIFTSSLLFYIWYADRSHQRRMIVHELDSAMEQVQLRIREAFNVRLTAIGAIVPIVEKYLSNDMLDRDAFVAVVSPLFRRFGGFRAINWIDSEGRITWIYPEKGNRAALGKSVMSHPDHSVSEAFGRARESNEFAMTDVIALFQGGYGVATYFPVRTETGMTAGYINAVFSIVPILESASEGFSTKNFTIRHENRTLLQQGHPAGMKRGSSFRLDSINLSLMIWPDSRLTGKFERPYRLPLLILLLTVAAMLSLAIMLLQRRYYILKEMDRRLGESEQTFRCLVEHSLAGIYLIQDGVFRYVNPRFCEVFGYDRDEIIDRMSPLDLVHAEDRPMVEDNLRKRLDGTVEAVHYSFRAMRRDGEIFTVEAYGARTVLGSRPAVIGMLVDVTEKKKLEAQLRQAQRLESVGLLAGGIAHDFNNILTAVNGYAEMLGMRLEDETLKQYAINIRAAAERGANLTQGLLAFSRRQVLQPQPVRLKEALSAIESIIHRLIPENIEISIEYRDSRYAFVDTAQIEQVLMNLVTNARDAMPEGGRLHIETFDVTLDAAHEGGHPWGTRAGEYVCLAVTDTGHGMPPEVQARVFEPFFTTKETGKGSGLGLATVYGIIKQHDGFVHLYSEPGRGTTFKVYLPVSVSGPNESAVPLSAEPQYLRGTETVLVAEDDEIVQAMITTTLKEEGYSVITVSDGDAAIRAVSEAGQDIALMILDVVMPRKSGKEVFDEAIGRGYRGRCIFVSGYAPNSIHEDFILKEGLHFLTKPFSRYDLLLTVRTVLDARD